MKNQVTKVLSDEHVYILKVVNALLKESSALRAGKASDKIFFSKALDFVRNFADKFHHVKEEDVLFVELCKDTVDMHCNPTEQMRYEHDLGRGFVKEIDEGVAKNDVSKVIENSVAYANLLQEHIFKEDNILFPMANDALSESAQLLIADAFKKAEQKFSAGEKEKYVAIADEFEKRNY